MTKRIFGKWLATAAQECTCYGPSYGEPHEPHCGWESLCYISEVCTAIVADDDAMLRAAKAGYETMFAEDYPTTGVEHQLWLQTVRTMFKAVGEG